MNPRWIVSLLVIPFFLAAQSTPPARPEEEGIRKLVDGFIDAWNRHDAHAFAATFAEDADFTNVRGVGAHGRAAVEEFHAPPFATVFKASHQSASQIQVRFLTTDLASVDVRWEMTGALGPDGSPIPLRQGLLNWIVTGKEGRWLILIMHNQDLLPRR
jgi:uncharacterized protein (TIGR02246 family)